MGQAAVYRRRRLPEQAGQENALRECVSPSSLTLRLHHAETQQNVAKQKKVEKFRREIVKRWDTYCKSGNIRGSNRTRFLAVFGKGEIGHWHDPSKLKEQLSQSIQECEIDNTAALFKHIYNDKKQRQWYMDCFPSLEIIFSRKPRKNDNIPQEMK